MVSLHDLVYYNTCLEGGALKLPSGSTCQSSFGTFTANSEKGDFCEVGVII
ncbi:hypothetical protein EXN66_Car001727 [Channa argus]|uniref:Uncharacterized protein n=1 Tax=Channa argus TaxID=215402 RepID=A0A6G1R1R8_CHAAH|nr:hypothetical protein EXN66_Car001727 [Channa argus]